MSVSKCFVEHFRFVKSRICPFPLLANMQLKMAVVVLLFSLCHFGLQNGLFRGLKRCVWLPKTHRLGNLNGAFRNSLQINILCKCAWMVRVNVFMLNKPFCYWWLSSGADQLLL